MPEGPPTAAPAALADAVAFLTRFRVPGRPASGAVDLPRAAPLFPLVGAAIGAIVGGLAEALDEELTPLLAATIAVAAEVALTGALHLDGLADTADGLAGATRERRLKIMRDHALGTYGATALVLVLLAKVGALAALAEAEAVAQAIAAYALSRAVPLPLAATLPYARADGGTGRSLTEGLGWIRAAVAVVLATAIAAGAEWPEGVLGLAALAVVVIALAGYARRCLGGVTGDVMGAAIELTATLALLAAVAAR